MFFFFFLFFLGCWSLQFFNGGRLTLLNSLYWPGMTFYHKVHTPHYGFLYVGNGKRNTDVPFIIWLTIFSSNLQNRKKWKSCVHFLLINARLWMVKHFFFIDIEVVNSKSDNVKSKIVQEFLNDCWHSVEMFQCMYVHIECFSSRSCCRIVGVVGLLCRVTRKYARQRVQQY